MSITAANGSFASPSYFISSQIPECDTVIEHKSLRPLLPQTIAHQNSGCYKRINSHQTLFTNIIEEAISAESGTLSPEKQAMLQHYAALGLRHVAQVVIITLGAQDIQIETMPPAKEESRKQTEAKAKMKSRVEPKVTARSVLQTEVRARVSWEPQAVQEPQQRPAPPSHSDPPARQVQIKERGIEVLSGLHERVPFGYRNRKCSHAYGPPTSLTEYFYFPSTHYKYKEFYGNTDSDTDSRRQNRSNAPSPSTTKANTLAVTDTNASDVEQHTEEGDPNERLSAESGFILPPSSLDYTTEHHVQEVVKPVENCQNTQKKSTQDTRYTTPSKIFSQDIDSQFTNSTETSQVSEDAHIDIVEPDFYQLGVDSNVNHQLGGNGQGKLLQSSTSSLSASRKRGRTDHDNGDSAKSNIGLRPTKRPKASLL